MQYYLRHYFNPDFDYLRPKPGIGEDGESSDLYSLGYVQNVIAGQLLAEVIPLEQAGAEPDPRFVLSRPVLPGGANTRVDPAYPNYLLSTSNGYVFYNNGKITVKRLLNVRQDVSFRTGNIFFVGDMAVHGSVRSGFSVQANNLRIMGMVEGGVARARRDLMVDGSTINAYGSVYVGRQLGNKAAISTKIYLGYDPLSIRQLEKIDKIISGLSQSITHLKAVAGHLPPDANEASRKLARLVEQRERIMKQRTELWSKLYLDENYMQNCRLMVPGKVYPGVEISVGRAFMLVERPYENVLFRLCYDDIIVEPLPPADKGKGK